MNNIAFRIFGAPYTFDLYQGTENEIAYFQKFDNGGKENVKLLIHRMMSGKVSYSYLRYNFISSTGRPNAFFGMSIVFDNEYCKDIQKLFELFDAIYNGLILKNGILLSALPGNPNAQAKYCVRTFAEASGEVINIENNIINNLNKHFVNDILPLDNSFLESNSMVKLNDKMGNELFVSALKKCSWVHISPEYSTNEEPMPNFEFIAKLHELIDKINQQVPQISVSALKKENSQNIKTTISEYLTIIEHALGQITLWIEKEYKVNKNVNLTPYFQKQPELSICKDELLKSKKTLEELYSAVGISNSGGSGSNGGNNVGDTTGGNNGGGHSGKSTGDHDGGESGDKNDLSSSSDGFGIRLSTWLYKYRPAIFGIVGVILLAVVILVILWVLPTPNPSIDTKKLKAQADSALLVKDYELAYSLYIQAKSPEQAKLAMDDCAKEALKKNEFQKAIDAYTKIESADQIENVKNKAFEYYKGKAAKAANSKTKDAYSKAIQILEEYAIKRYALNVEDLIEGYNSEIEKIKQQEQEKERKRKQEERKRKEQQEKNNKANNVRTIPQNLTINFPDGNKKRCQGKTFQVQAYQDGRLYTGEGLSWRLEGPLTLVSEEDRSKNPVNILVNTTTIYTGKIYLEIGGTRVATVFVSILP